MIPIFARLSGNSRNNVARTIQAGKNSPKEPPVRHPHFQDSRKLKNWIYNISRISGHQTLRLPPMDLVKSVSKKTSTLIIIKNCANSNFHVEFHRKSLNSIGWAGFYVFSLNAISSGGLIMYVLADLHIFAQSYICLELRL